MRRCTWLWFTVLFLGACGQSTPPIELIGMDDEERLTRRVLTAHEAAEFRSGLEQLDESGLPEPGSEQAGFTLAALRPDLHANEFRPAGDDAGRLYLDWWIEIADFDGEPPRDYVAVLKHLGSGGYYDVQAVVRSAKATYTQILRSELRGARNLDARIASCARAKGDVRLADPVLETVRKEMKSANFVERLGDDDLDAIRQYAVVGFGPPELGASGFVSVPLYFCWEPGQAEFVPCASMGEYYRRSWQAIVSELRELCAGQGLGDFVSALAEAVR